MKYVRNVRNMHYMNILIKHTVSIATTITTASSTTVTKTLPPEDVWFGSTPKHLYRGYVNQHQFHAAKPKKPPIKFIPNTPHRLGLQALHKQPPQELKPIYHQPYQEPYVPHYQEPVYEEPEYNYDEVYPFDIIKTKLKEPSYMKTPKLGYHHTRAKPHSEHLFGEVDFDSHDSTTAEPKPNEIKSIPRTAITKSLHTEAPVYTTQSIPVTSVYTAPTSKPTVHTPEPVTTVYTPESTPKPPPLYRPTTATVKPYAYATSTTPPYVSELPLKKVTKKPYKLKYSTMEPYRTHPTTPFKSHPIHSGTVKPYHTTFEPYHYDHHVKKVTKKPSFHNFKNDFYHHHHTTVKPVFHSADFEFHKVSLDPVNEVPSEFVDLQLKAKKPVKDLKFGYFEIPPEPRHGYPAEDFPHKIDVSHNNPGHFHSYKAVTKPYLDPGLKNGKPYQPLKPHHGTTIKPHAYASSTKPPIKGHSPIHTATVKPHHTTYEPFHHNHYESAVKRPYIPLPYSTPVPYHVTSHVDGFLDPYNEPDPYGINSGYHFPTHTVKPQFHHPLTHPNYHYHQATLSPHVYNPSTEAPHVYNPPTVAPHFYHTTTVKPHKHFPTSDPTPIYYPTTPSPSDFYHKSVSIDPYAPKHHHYDHKFKYNTHQHLKYPVHHKGTNIPSDPHGHDLLNQPLALAGLHDPWLPQGGDFIKLKPSSHPTYKPYEEYDLSTHYKYEHSIPKKSFYESEHAKRNIPTDLGKTKGLDVVENALHDLDHFGHAGGFEESDYLHYNWDDYELEKEPQKYSNGFYKLQSPALGSIRPTLKDLKQEFSRPPFSPSSPSIKGTFKPSLITGRPKGNVSTKKPVKVVKRKKKPIIRLPKLPKLKLPKIVATTVAPPTHFLSTIMPKIKNFGNMAQNLQQTFIEKPIGRVKDFVSGFFGPKISKDSGLSDRTMSIDDNYSDFEEDFEESFEEFSEGGQKELTKLERIQMLLRLARDKPLL